MKKTASALAAAALAVTGLALSAPAAQAGTDKVDICHASAPGKWEAISVDVNALNGHDGHGDDIWEGFQYTNKRGEVITVPGQNWDERGAAVWANGCSIPTQQVAYVPPVYTPGTCIDPNGSVTIPAQPDGVTYAENAPRLNEDGEWYVWFKTQQGYTFADGQTEDIWSTPVVSPSDEECELAETGFGEDVLPWAAGGLLVAGAVAIFASRRREVR